MSQSIELLSREDTLHVTPAGPNQQLGLPRFDSMSKTDIVRIDNDRSHKVEVFCMSGDTVCRVDPKADGRDKEGDEAREGVWLMGLTIVSPVIHAAVKALNKSSTERNIINQVLLPRGDPRAYEEIMLWIKTCVTFGRMMDIRDLKGHPLTAYGEIIWLCPRLKLDWLEQNVRKKVNASLRVDGRKGFTIHPGDIEHYVRARGYEHWITKKIVTAVAWAEKKGKLHKGFQKILYADRGIYASEAGFYDAVQAKMDQIR